MKTNDLFIVTATIAYTYLFYEQNAGVNFFIFNILIVLLLGLKERKLLLQLPWLAVAAGSLLSGFFVFWWGNTLAVIANICSLIALVGLSFDPESSLLFAAMNTLVSIVVSIPRFLNSISLENQPKNGKASIFKKILLLLVPAFVALFFAGVYYAANPIFAKFIDQINFDFINFNLIMFMLSGFCIMFGVFNIYRLKVNDADKNTPDILRAITADEHIQTGSGVWLSVSSELLMGVGLFAFLNTVLLCVNGLDVYYMWVVNRLPDGVTMASFLHESTDSLIFSILIAIGLVLFVFRGYLNFAEDNKWLKTTAYAWIAQNVLLIITTANINWWYVQSYGLTRKRIGVCVYLLLCLTGLVTTFIKIAEKKSNWFLFRKNAWVFYIVLIVSCFFNWDEMIVNYNFTSYKAHQIPYVDMDYETSLGYNCITSLFKFYADEKDEKNPGKQVFTSQVVHAMYSNYQQLKKEEGETGWQSYCYNKHTNLKETETIIETRILQDK